MQKVTLLMFLVFSCALMNAQTELDSLFITWQDHTKTDSSRAKALDDYIWFGYVHSKPDSAIVLSDTLFEFSRKLGIKKIMANALNMKGAAYYIKSDYPNALKNHQYSLKIKEEIGNKRGVASSLNNIGLIYKNQGNYTQALEYWNRSLKIYEELEDKRGIAFSKGNIGIIYRTQGNYPLALDYYKQSLKIREEIEDNKGIAESLNNIGVINFYQGNYKLALDYYERSLKIQEEIEDENGMALSLGNIGELYKTKGAFKDAIAMCQRSFNLSKEIGDIDQQKDACSCLYETYKIMGKDYKALEFHEQLTVLNDSLFNEANTKKMTQLEMQYDFDKKEAATQMEQEKKDVIAAQELKRKNLERNGFIAGFAVVLLFAGIFFRQRNRIGKEKDRSEELLLNILPEEVAEELKEKGHSEAQLIEHVTVLFTDFKGFTALSEQLSPKELVEDLHTCFSEFDRICEKYGIEKIKTIGDSYMAAGGLPSVNNTHAQDVVKATLEMAEVIEKTKAEKTATNQPFFEVRIGVHTGPVVAGIVGVKKFQYDIWGDTVNTASRMESSGEVGKVNVSESTYTLLKDDKSFTFESRGKIQAKGKGEIEMYFVEKNI
ncbi:MAG: tetratricopeptide repeat protein [Flavobacteriaceae bacterium]|nr:tetratricopeptide repeat protein [Flavobacteriaceae bacterium]